MNVILKTIKQWPVTVKKVFYWLFLEGSNEGIFVIGEGTWKFFQSSKIEKISKLCKRYLFDPSQGTSTPVTRYLSDPSEEGLRKIFNF